MKLLILSLLLLISTDPREIAKVNSLKKEAEKAFLDGNYELATSKYQLLDSMGVEDDAIQLNLAHALYQLNDTSIAKTKYQTLLTSSNKKIKSIAYQQLGVMQKKTNKLEEALQTLKYSIKADPTNEGARYDYELVKKLLKEQEEQEEEKKRTRSKTGRRTKTKKSKTRTSRIATNKKVKKTKIRKEKRKNQKMIRKVRKKRMEKTKMVKSRKLTKSLLRRK